MSLDMILTLCGMALGVAGFFFCSHRANLPRDDLKPKRMPWVLFMLTCAFATVIMGVHLINVFGFETGQEHSLLGRRM